jgi:hypothetical protein
MQIGLDVLDGVLGVAGVQIRLLFGVGDDLGYGMDLDFTRGNLLDQILVDVAE